jgi:hypothetical protein
MKTYEIIFSKLTECETYVGLYEVYDNSYKGKTALVFDQNSLAKRVTLYFWDHQQEFLYTLLYYQIIKRTRERLKKINILM